MAEGGGGGEAANVAEGGGGRETANVAEGDGGGTAQHFSVCVTEDGRLGMDFEG